MNAVQFNLKKANTFFPFIILVGFGIGTANYIMNGDLNWIQWSIISLSTSFLIGYTLVVIGLNKLWFILYFKSKIKLYLFIILVFFLTGILATEVEHTIRSLIFQSQQFQLFSAGKMYLFNGIISLILGISFFQNNFSKNKAKTPIDSLEPIINIPVKKGENIFLIPIQDIAYFEAYDNYAFVHDVKGEKKLCDYSLLFLEKRLDEKFSRIHRKYIVNKTHIKQIKPHLNGRFLILFDNRSSPITSSKSYSATIRKLIKIE